MDVVLDELEITIAQLEQVTGLNISPTTVQGMIRPGVWRSPQKLISVLITQGLIFGVMFILCVGIILVIIQGQENLPRTRDVFLLAIGFAMLIILAWQTWQLWRGRKFQSLFRLLQAVERHNEIIQAIQVMDELDSLQTDTRNPEKRQQLVTALRATRESLMSGLATERILRKHQKLITRRQELFTNIETNLATLQSLQLNPEAESYRSLLQDALDIGLIVQQELQ